MSQLTDPATWRSHPQTCSAYLYLLAPDIIYNRRVNMGAITYPVSSLTYDNPDANPGAFGDVHIDMTVEIRDGSTEALKGIVRVRDDATADTIPISPFSQSDIDLADDDLIYVLNDYRLWSKIPRIDPTTGTAYKDYAIAFPGATQAQPPVSNPGGWYAGEVSGDPAIITVTFDGTNSYAVANGASISSYTWDVDDGTITVGNANSSAITATFPAGYRWVSLTVVDSNGNSHIAYTLVVATDGDALLCQVAQLSGSLENGWEAAFRVLESDVSAYPTGTAVIFWCDESYAGTPGSLNGQTGREHVKFTGWTLRDTVTIEPETSNWDIQAQNAVGIMRQLPAFPQTTKYENSPTSWYHVAYMNWWRHAHYLMQWHSTLLTVCDVERAPSYAEFSLAWLDANAGSLLDQFEFVAQSITAAFTCDHNGICYWRENPHLMSAADRAALTVIVTLEDSDWYQSVVIDTAHRPKVAVIEAAAIIASATSSVPVKAIAPGATPGQGPAQETFSKQVVASQTDLNERLGRLYAFKNIDQVEVPINIINGGLVADPAWREWIQFTQASSTNSRGTGFSSQKFVLNAVTVRYDHAAGYSREIWNMQKTISSSAPAAVTIQMPDADAPGGTAPYIPTYGTWEAQTLPAYTTYIPLTPFGPNELDYPGGVWGVAWATSLYRSNEIKKASPIWRAILTVPDYDVLSFMHANAPTVPDDAVDGWALTNEGLYYGEDIFGDIPAFEQKQAFSGGTLVRQVAGVAGDSGVAVFGRDITSGEWVETFDFTSDEYADYFASWLGASYSAGVGWVSNDVYEAGPDKTSNYNYIYLTLPDTCTMKQMTCDYSNTDWSGNLGTPGATVRQHNGGYVTIPVGSLSGWAVTVGAHTGDWSYATGYEFDKTLYLVWSIYLGYVDGANPTAGDSTITEVELTGDGYNPFSDIAWVRYSDDNGDTVTKTTVGYYRYDEGYDMDDYNLGVHIAAANWAIYHSTAYDGAFSAITGLTSIAAGTNITCIRVPLLVIATQAANNGGSNLLEFVYGTEASVGGVTLTKVLFDFSTHAVDSETDITPNVDGTDYYVVGQEALETAGADTRHMLAFCKPDGGGTTELLHSSDGGANWASRGELDGNFVRWVPGSTTDAMLSGDDWVGYTNDAGATVVEQTGNQDDETTFGGAYSLQDL